MMLQPSWENLDGFLNADEFAVSAVLQLQGGTTRAIVGIFDEPFMDATLGEYRMDQVAPRFTCRADQVGDVRRGDVLVVQGRTLDVMQSPQADGTGMATIRLAPRRSAP
jgi:hypothetical protein